MYIVEIQENCWLVEWRGKPGRSFVKENAKRFKTINSAEKALNKAREYRPLKDAIILED